MSPIEIVKKHPVAIGIGAVVIVGAFILLSSGVGGSQVVGSTGPSDAEIAAGLQLQQLQAAGQAQSLQVGAQREIELANTAAQLELGKLSIAQQSASDSLAASVALAQINANQQTTSLTSTLASQVQIAGINADPAQTPAMLATMTRPSELQASTATAAINAQVQIAKINKPKQGLFSKIFG